MKNYHILLVSHFMGNDCIPRVRIKSQLFKQSIKVPYTNEPGEHVNPKIEAKKYLENKGFVIVGMGELTNDYVLISETFEPIK